MQATQLGYMPRVHIQHTSASQYGQIYIGGANWLLMLLTIGLVLGFRSSSALAGAYFLYAPFHSFMITDGLDLLELTFFGLLAILASRVVSGFAADAQVKPRQRSGSLLRRLRQRRIAPWTP